MATLERNNPQPGFLTRRRGQQQSSELFPSASDLFLLNPFSLMRRVTEEMNRAFGQSGSGMGAMMTWSPAIEINQKPGKVEISAELPGVKPEDVKVSVEDDMLVLEGERSEKKEEEGEGGVRRSEIRYGKFYRAIPLADGAKTEEAQAKFEHGVLRVEVPIAEQVSQRRQIPVAGTTGGTTAGTMGQTAAEEPGTKRAA
jgi:HSP20 family protein